MKKLFLLLFIPFLFACTSSNSNTGNQTTPTQSRNVKYEITGDYSGKVTIVYQNQSGTFITETNVALPWTKEFTAEATTQSVGYNLRTTSTSTLGGINQTVIAKLYIGGEIKKSETKLSDASGSISFDNLMFYF
ncbi:MAG: MmpS family transport accessory protein [Limnohabitans sp.]|nr:MmpS family transport accessory protein [Limnohabitans sp.]